MLEDNIEVVGPVKIKDVRAFLNATSTTSELPSSSTLSLSGNQLNLILFHGTWNGYTRIEPKANSKDSKFLKLLEWSLKKHGINNSILQLTQHDTILGINNNNKIKLASVMIENNDAEENLKFAINELNLPSTLPSLAVLYLPKSRKDYKLKYINIDSKVLNACINTMNVNVTIDYDKYSATNEQIIQGIKNTLQQCINELNNDDKKQQLDNMDNKNRKRKSIADGYIKDKENLNSTSMETDNNDIVDDNNKKTKKDEQQQQIRIFISGDRSQVGKSSICLGLLGSLLKLGYKSSELAYIKPATQCESTTLVSKFCDANNISCQPIGPLVYYKGYTREFLSGNTNTSEELLEQMAHAVDDVGTDKKIVIIDGVGYPSVGSICGTDNATIASRCGISVNITPNNNENDKKHSNIKRLPALVLIVGKSGVGDAVDSFNLNRTYFEYNNVPILGVIFNRFSVDGYYAMDSCQREITKYFARNNITKYYPFGFIPEISSLVKLKEQEESTTAATDVNTKTTSADTSSVSITAANEFISIFQKHVNVEEIIKQASNLTNQLVSSISTNVVLLSSSIDNNNGNKMEIEMVDNNNNNNNNNLHSQTSNQKACIPVKTVTSSNNSNKKVILTREQIEKAAKAAGAIASSA